MIESPSIFLMISQDVIFKPYFVYKIIEELEKENLFVSKILEIKKKKNSPKNQKNNHLIWSKIAFIQLSFLFLSKKIFSVLPLPIILKWKSTVKLVAKKKGIKYKFIDNLNEYLSITEFKKDDIVFSFQHQIIKNPEKYKFALINCHPGDLSLYRGIKPIFWAMFDKKEFGIISIHHIDKGIDTGKLIYGHKFKLSNSLADNYYEAYSLAPKVVTKAILLLIKNNIKKSPFTNSKVLKPYKNSPKKADVINFYKSGSTTRISIINFLRLLRCF